MVYCLWFAGVLQLLVAVSNFFAIKMLRYRETLAAVSPHVAQVFVVQNIFIVFMVAGLALMCFAFAPELTNRTALSRSIDGFAALFWFVRLMVQWFYYDRELRRKYRVMDALFSLAFLYLTVVFCVAAVS